MEPVFSVNVSVMNIYRDPTFKAALTTQGLLGENCRILEEREDWIRIRQWDDYEGWAHRLQGVINSRPYPANRIFYGLYGMVYTDEDQRHGLRDLTYGSRLEAEEQSPGSYRIHLPDDTAGWAQGEFLTSGPQPTRENLVKTARKFLGAPYHWGGKSPKGFDCSGFIQTIYSSVGVTLPRDSHQQAHRLRSAAIETPAARPGDLYFFGQEEAISHVALATGRGHLIHSQGWVKEESLTETDPHYNHVLAKQLIFTTSVEEFVRA